MAEQDRELIAKVVFGEATLGEVFSRFEHRISSVTIAVLRNTHAVDHEYHSWWIERGMLIFTGGDSFEERRCSLALASKVKVNDNCLFLVHEKTNFRLTFLESKKIAFHEILPGAA